MMRVGMHRIGQAMLLWAVVGGPILAWWPAALGFPALWAVVALGVLANALQPSYRLRDAARMPADRGTFHQIMLTAYGTQAAALVELGLRRPPALPFDALGVSALLAMAAGLGLRTWAVTTLDGSFTLQVGVKPAQRLVRAGPYRLIRHPSYTGAFVALIASAVLLRAWVTAVLGAIALYAAFRRRIRHEERLLAAALPGYRRYMARTGALLPRCGLGPAGRRRRARRDRSEASPGSGRPPGGRRLPA
jgi:protein-S-isoprenylcysteine O-methyltransferase Ste14